jgi:hypothetical protein
MVPYISTNRAAQLLAGPTPTFVLVQNPSALAPSRETNRLHVLFQTAGRDGLSLISNHPRLEWTSDLVFDLDALELRLHNARIHRLSLHELVLQRVAPGARVEILNRALSPQHFRVRWIDDQIAAGRLLMPGERWVM